ncbi:hypothetical protein CJF42_23375 [Pseudoalteromonas sp. NBT06-2]|uniref:phage tail-collar fiber domain-containing protein n=1 Tax=Pseudoalteromonas sp. NBT06-2 TaxID=2025950 RepID=UPI000BA563BC|nr:phage tail protein [Pseudoalteromonas sp. NBT06-2]PAJ72049.1 hypothetical protein CJF42_23375 [Pseudoalteromonas sp. NBT06-2]
MSDYTPLITQAGLNAAVNATQGGFKIEISHIAVGDKGYLPNRNQTVLQNEKDRVMVSGGKHAGPGQWHLTGVFEKEDNFAVREVGFYLTDGTLFAVWSHPVNTLFYQTPIAKVIQGFDLILSGVPVDAISVDISGDLNLYYGDEFLSLAVTQTKQLIAQVQTMHRQIQFNTRLQQSDVAITQAKQLIAQVQTMYHQIQVDHKAQFLSFAVAQTKQLIAQVQTMYRQIQFNDKSLKTGV